MPRGERVEPEALGALEQATKLDVPVALDAGIGRLSRRMAQDVGVHDLVLERVGEIEHMVSDAQLLRHPPGIIDIGNRAAAGVRSTTPQLQRGADHFMAALRQNRRGDRRINPSGHCDEHPHGDKRTTLCGCLRPAVVRRSWAWRR